MPQKKKTDTVIAVCIQEPTEDGSSMDLGLIKGDELRFLHQAFITDSISHALAIKDVDVRLFYIDMPERRRLVKIVKEYVKKKQAGKKINERFETVGQDRDRWGIRIESIFQDCFDAGYKNVLVIGSRTPTVSTDKIKTALRMLKESDAVFGPTVEGRYYTIGMTGSYQISLSEFDWKSPRIYSEVADAFTEKKLSWSELEIWYTVEVADDLEMLARDINQFRFEGDEDTARESEIVLQRLLAKLEM